MKIIPFESNVSCSNKSKIDVLKELIELAEAGKLGDIAIVYENYESERPITFVLHKDILFHLLQVH